MKTMAPDSIDAGFGGPSATRPQGAASRPDGDPRAASWCALPTGWRLRTLLLANVAAVAVALEAAGLPWAAALLLATLATGMCVFASRDAWRRPERYTTKRLLAKAARAFVLSYLGSALAWFVLDFVQYGNVDPPRLLASVEVATRKSVPVLALVVVVMIVMMGIVARVKRVRLHNELAVMRIEQERDATARQLAESRLQLLQKQIQPHFVFNTLAALQHWVDEGDARSGPLLRALTTFLRGSTELLNQDRTTLAVEVDNVRHYLDIMAARLGGRLRYEIAIAAGTGDRPIPPGLLLTLVENAIEHGLSPALRGGTVRIVTVDDGDAWSLTVDDDGVGLAPGWAERIGLANCRERLRHLFGPGATLTLRADGAHTIATVRIEP